MLWQRRGRHRRGRRGRYQPEDLDSQTQLPGRRGQLRLRRPECPRISLGAQPRDGKQGQPLYRRGTRGQAGPEIPPVRPREVPVAVRAALSATCSKANPTAPWRRRPARHEIGCPQHARGVRSRFVAYRRPAPGRFIPPHARGVRSRFVAYRRPAPGRFIPRPSPDAPICERAGLPDATKGHLTEIACGYAGKSERIPASWIAFRGS
jgi:hypothetical protein